MFQLSTCCVSEKAAFNVTFSSVHLFVYACHFWKSELAFLFFQEEFYGREVILADRDMVEQQSGTPKAATTHFSFLIRFALKYLTALRNKKSVTIEKSLQYILLL